MTPRNPIPPANRLRSETGSAMTIAVIVLLVVGTLSSAVIATALQTNSSTRRDANHKNALEAAEAGLQIALYRLNMLAPGTLLCVGDIAQLPDSTGWCASSAYSLGNGTTYQYWTTPIQGSSNPCVGLRFTSTDILQRCITAVGTSHGVSARSQIRAVAFAAQPLFPLGGAIGLTSVSMSGSATVTGLAGSNGAISTSGSSNAAGIDLGPNGSFTSSSSVSSGTITRLSSPIVLDAVDPGTSNQSSLTSCPVRQQAGYPACNDDYRISNGLLNPPSTPYDQSSAGVSFTASTRTLALSGASLTLGGGLYNFCNLTASGASTITIAPSAQTEIIIDSPDDPNSGCPSGSGNLTLSGSSAFINQSMNPLALQIYVYGLNDGSGKITLSGSSAMYGVLYAPQSQVTLSGTGRIYGGVAGRTLTISGSGLTWDNRVATLQATTTGLYYRAAWAQCTPTPTVSTDPGSGCG
jgi:hypothetical protein